MLKKLVCKAENQLNLGICHFLKHNGWQVELIGYGGLGNPKQVRIIGRALLTPGFEQAFQMDMLLRESLADLLGEGISRLPSLEEIAQRYRPPAGRGWRQFVDAQIPFQQLLVQVGHRSLIVKADRGGYLDLQLSGHGLNPGWHYALVRGINPAEAQKHQDLATGKVKRPSAKHHPYTQWVRYQDFLIPASPPVKIPIRIVADTQHTGIVSDVDDTVIISALPRPLTAAKHAFISHLSTRQAAPHMADLLAGLASKLGEDGHLAPVVYLSTGAWNIVPSLRNFLARNLFPPGMFLLTDWGPSPDRWFRSGKAHKCRELTRLAKQFPKTKWILVGDNGQLDPWIYSQFAQRFPDQVAAILIRSLPLHQQLLKQGKLLKRADQIREALSQVPAGIPVLVGRQIFNFPTQLHGKTH